MKTPQDQVRGERGEGISLQHSCVLTQLVRILNSQLTRHDVACHCVVTVSTGDSSSSYIIRLMSVNVKR